MNRFQIQLAALLPGPGASSKAWLASERAFARAAKDAIVSVYGGGASGKHRDNGVLGAFRRRIDFVAPFRRLD